MIAQVVLVEFAFFQFSWRQIWSEGPRAECENSTTRIYVPQNKWKTTCSFSPALPYFLTQLLFLHKFLLYINKAHCVITGCIGLG